jgi:hypothetical protein
MIRDIVVEVYHLVSMENHHHAALRFVDRQAPYRDRIFMTKLHCLIE